VVALYDLISQSFTFPESHVGSHVHVVSQIVTVTVLLFPKVSK